ncbi:MAG: HDIG domain-containing protein [Chloroflexi bacterium]|nr:MAG: HDIG domain-containing protein [Chloroflexota bacterium]
MIVLWITDTLEKHFRVAPSDTMRALQWSAYALAAAIFLLFTTVIIAFDSIFPSQSLESLQIGDIAEEDIHAPVTMEFESTVLTEQRRQAAEDSVRTIFDSPDPTVVRQQSLLARQIFDFIDNVRLDPYASREQKIDDLHQINALTLDDSVIQRILDVDDETWRAMDEQVVSVLERVMRDAIRETDLATVRSQLPTQVSIRFSDESDLAAIVAIVEDLMRPNSFENPEATEQARLAARESVAPQTRVFERGQIIVRAGERVDELAFEALQQLRVSGPANRRGEEVVRSLLASIVVMVMLGLYVGRFHADLFDDLTLLAVLTAIFMITLLGARIVGGDTQQFYRYPTAAMALLYVVVTGPELAIMAIVGIAILMGVMANESLEISTLVTSGGAIGALTLRRSERLNSYFFAGFIIAVTNVVVITIFNLELLSSDGGFSGLFVDGIFNGALAGIAAIGGMYVITFLFNLPTSLKLIELSQPNQPLLQRLIREAPGTYQHSLQVANLSEQAANAIGANADLVRVAALYHDIGKMENPAFFVENQGDVGNPHDVLNDPYRSADIIISHVTDGDEMAKHYHLPQAIREFICQHHGTSVLYFYQQAVAQAGGDASEVDIEHFTYPGPRPQSREAGIMMLADSCEATIRARRPTSKQEIAEIVEQIIDNKRREGQLDDSNLTLNDLKVIRNTFVEMLQAVFHPRINYPAAAKPRQAETKVESMTSSPAVEAPTVQPDEETRPTKPTKPKKPQTQAETATPKTTTAEVKRPRPQAVDIPKVPNDDTAPLPEVPPLQRNREHHNDADGLADTSNTNGKPVDEAATHDEPQSEDK